MINKPENYFTAEFSRGKIRMLIPNADCCIVEHVLDVATADRLVNTLLTSVHLFEKANPIGETARRKKGAGA
jgi:hypothetical protein